MVLNKQQYLGQIMVGMELEINRIERKKSERYLITTPIQQIEIIE